MMTTLHCAEAKGQWALQRFVEQTGWAFLASGRYVLVVRARGRSKASSYARICVQHFPKFRGSQTESLTPWEGPNQRSRPESNRFAESCWHH